MKLRALLFCAFAAIASSAPPAFAQSLSLTYKLDGKEPAQRAGSGSSACAGLTANDCTVNPALGRYSRAVQSEETVVRALAPVSANASAPRAPAADPTGIPFLGEEPPHSASDTRGVDPELNLTMERPRVRSDIERRFYDAAQEARFNRNAINALGLELMLPIQSKVKQSADPALPD